MRVTLVWRAISEAATETTSHAALAIFTIRRRRWRMAKFCPLLDESEVDILDFLRMQQRRPGKEDTPNNMTDESHFGARCWSKSLDTNVLEFGCLLSLNV